MDIKTKLIDFRGLLNKKGPYHFVNTIDLVKIFLQLFYSEKIVVVLYDCKKRINQIPKLVILKRDNWDAYHIGEQSDIAVIEFDDLIKAQDWVFSFPIDRDDPVKYDVYMNCKKIMDQNGRIKNG